MGCTTKRFKKTKLCSGDLRHQIDILARTLGTPGPDDTVPPITLTLIKPAFCGIETKAGTPRFNNVNINDVRTHIFTVRQDPLINTLDEGDTFIRLTKLGVSRLFRVLDIKINDEDPYFLDFSATERGIEPAIAALA